MTLTLSIPDADKFQSLYESACREFCRGDEPSPEEFAAALLKVAMKGLAVGRLEVITFEIRRARRATV